MIEPAVCVPSASGTWKSATAAADPDDEPPGVRAGSCGLRVSPGPKKANSVVTVLPRMIAPAALSSANDEGIGRRLAAGKNRRAEFRRKVLGVDDVLDADGNAGERPHHFSPRPPRVAGPRRLDGRLAADAHPSADLRVAPRYTLEAGPDKLFGRQIAHGERFQRLRSRQACSAVSLACVEHRIASLRPARIHRCPAVARGAGAISRPV